MKLEVGKEYIFFDKFITKIISANDDLNYYVFDRPINEIGNNKCTSEYIKNFAFEYNKVK